jgi:hypothetical protein
VKGTYDRDTRTWTKVSYFDPIFQQWRGEPGGGDVTLFDMVHYMATNGTNPACLETINMWERVDEPIKIFLDSTNQPHYDAKTGVLITGAVPGDAVSGTEVLWRELVASPGRGGPAFQRISGSEREFDRVAILRGFVKDEEFDLGRRRALRLQQQVAKVLVPPAAS